MAKHKKIIFSILLWCPALFSVCKILAGICITLVESELALAFVIQPLAWTLVLRNGGFMVLCQQHFSGAERLSAYKLVVKGALSFCIILVCGYLDYQLIKMLPQMIGMFLFIGFVMFDSLWELVTFYHSRNRVSLVKVALEAIRQKRNNDK